MRAQSDSELWHLREPLGLNMGSHRWLSEDREESYSDWLAWILQGMLSASGILPLFGLGDEPTNSDLGFVETVRREERGEHGRTDIVVCFERKGLLVEVKVQPPGDDLYSQLQRYAEWAVGQQARPLLVLLVRDEPEKGIAPFRSY